MTIRHFEVQTRTVSDGWINTWHKNDKPLVFATELAARQAMGEFFQDLPDEMAKSYSVIDYRVRAVHFDEALSPPFYACPDCGCTDVETSAWINVNTGQPTNDEGPLDAVFCPQCDQEVGKHRHMIEVDTLQPYNEEAKQ